MHGIGFRNKSVDPSHFAMVPRADIPRSVFHVESAHKTTFDAGYLVPVYCDEVLPGDSHHLQMTAFARMSTPIFPLMDNLTLTSFFFFVPCRLVWANWKRFMGEQPGGPSDSISYVIPVVTNNGGTTQGHLCDYFGIPITGNANPVSFNALPLRAYNLIYNEWFRDENLQGAVQQNTNDGPDNYAAYNLLRRGKRHDYFTSCLPWPQKGGTAVTVPLAGTAPVTGLGFFTTGLSAGTNIAYYETGGAHPTYARGPNVSSGGVDPVIPQSIGIKQDPATGYPLVFADLSQATGATINALRQSFQIQKLLERDARGGTRYTEIVRAHFGVISPDARQQRPEYLGGGMSPININPVAQTSVTAATPQGNLAGVGTGVAHHGFNKAFTEHGYILGLVHIKADLTYQQGLHKMWSRSTRYDFYWPAFAHLGEQAVLNKEIYCKGDANDPLVFGYQERWAEYRYKPSMITGTFRSSATGTLDGWHLSQNFTSLPTLGTTFIQDTPPVSRVVAAGAAANGMQFLFDSVFSVRKVRPMPAYSVPGFIDRF